MRSAAVAADIARLWSPDNLRRAAPGVALCAVIAAVAYIADTRSLLRFGAVWVPPLILTPRSDIERSRGPYFAVTSSALKRAGSGTHSQAFPCSQRNRSKRGILLKAP